MKTLFFILIVVVACFSFSSCLKDVKLQKYTYYVPEYKLKSDVRANIKSDAAQSLEQPGRIYVKGNYIYINEYRKGIHIIDYSQPSSPQNVAFIPIPGNENLTISGNYLYADEYSDLVTIDITNPLESKLVDVSPHAFPDYYGYNGFSDTNYMIQSWRRIDTMVKSNDQIVINPGPIYYYMAYDAANFSSAPKASSGNGSGGSMAQFAVLNSRLYTVSFLSLNIFNIETESKPSFVKTVNTTNGTIETIYPYQNNLFLGGNSGMYIYDATAPDDPVASGMFGHVRTCDPVIAETNTAYVTLRSGTVCQGFTNELDVLNTTDITNPVLVKSYAFTNPRGLAKDGNYLFVCDGTDGLKIMDASDANNIQPLSQVTGFEANDVILNNGIAVVTATNGLYLIDYSNIADAKVLGKINIAQ